MDLRFRKLRADEIECRIATVAEKGVSLLLYKDARVDQNILDETVGPLGWQRRHSRDNANCIVSIWDEDKKQWIEKEDTGTESYAEAKKGLASDSFKRACFNWGIGRELYTAPFIWVTDCKTYSTGRKDNRNKEVFSCKDSFKVSDIAYDDCGEITCLTIKNAKSNKVAYKMSCPSGQKELLEDKYANTIFQELQRTGIGMKGFLKSYGVPDVHSLTFLQYKDAMDKLRGKPDKPLNPDMIPPENCSDLPFSLGGA